VKAGPLDLRGNPCGGLAGVRYPRCITIRSRVGGGRTPTTGAGHLQLCREALAKVPEWGGKGPGVREIAKRPLCRWTLPAAARPPAMIWMDRRAERSRTAHRTAGGGGDPPHHRATGPTPSMSPRACSGCGITNPGPQADREVRVQVNGYINYRLTGRIGHGSRRARRALMQMRNSPPESGPMRYARPAAWNPAHVPRDPGSPRPCREKSPPRPPEATAYAWVLR